MPFLNKHYVDDEVISSLESFPANRLFPLKPGQKKLDGRLKAKMEILDEVNREILGKDWYVDTAALSDIYRISEIDYVNFEPFAFVPEDVGEYVGVFCYWRSKYLLVARENETDDVIGYVSIAGDEFAKSLRPLMHDLFRDDAAAYINTISVDNVVQRKGVGAALLKAAEKSLATDGKDKLFLHSWRRNPDVSHDFFKKQGYADLRDIPGYYKNGDTATVMYMPLAQPWRSETL